jgi:uncharacterized protein (TIGR02246 family)
MRRPPLALFLLGLAGCQTVPSPDATKAEVAQATQSWVSAFNACNAAEAAALYDSEAVLWGTVAPVVISSPIGVRQYFERACSSNPQPKVLFGEQLVRVYGETAINTGSYTFTVFPGGQARQFPARYSFTYRKKGGQWLIVDHHSSAVPTPPTSPASAPAR